MKKINFLKSAVLLLVITSLSACKNEVPGPTASDTSTTSNTQTTTEQTELDTDETEIEDDENDDENPAATLAAVVLENAPFPMMISYGTTEEIEQFTGVVMPDNFDFAYQGQMMSVHLAEVLIIITPEGEIDDAYAIVEARGEKLRSDMAFYPTQQAAAESTIYGKKGNVAYLICVEGAKEAEAALLEAIQ